MTVLNEIVSVVEVGDVFYHYQCGRRRSIGSDTRSRTKYKNTLLIEVV